MQNTYKKATSFFILGVLAVQGATSIGFTTQQNPADYIASASADELKTYEEMIISDEASLLSIDELKALIELREAELEKEATEGEVLIEETKEEVVELESAPEQKDPAEEVELEAAPEEVLEDSPQSCPQGISCAKILSPLEEKEAAVEETETLSDAEIAAQEITDAELLKVFVQNKSRFAENTDFIDAWKTLSESYTQKKDSEIFSQKVAFLEIYLDLSRGIESSEVFSLEYKGVSTEVFEANIMGYLDARGATDAQYSNARKLVKMVEIFNEISNDEVQKQAEMQKSISTQFGRVL